MCFSLVIIVVLFLNKKLNTNFVLSTVQQMGLIMHVMLILLVTTLYFCSSEIGSLSYSFEKKSFTLLHNVIMKISFIIVLKLFTCLFRDTFTDFYSSNTKCTDLKCLKYWRGLPVVREESQKLRALFKKDLQIFISILHQPLSLFCIVFY